jgi:hypothetical protein
MTNTNDNKGQHMNHYFATDGNYGNAENLIIIDTTDWTEDEWDIIDQSPENDRTKIAQQLSQGQNENQLSLFEE